MRWYYSSDDSGKHGLVEQEILFEMARRGELKPTDLVWQEDSEQGWTLASSVEGLFAIQPPTTSGSLQLQREPVVAPPAQAASQTGRAVRAPKRPNKLGKVLVVLSILALLMIAAVVATVIRETRRRNEIPPEPVITEPPIELVRSNRVVTLSRQIDGLIQREDLARACTLWAEMRKNDDSGAATAAYAKRITALKAELDHFTEMQSALRKGLLTVESAAELIGVYEKRGGAAELLAFAESVRADRDALTPEVCLSLARLFTVLQEHERLSDSLNAFSSIAPTNGTPLAHMEVVKMYCVENQPTNAMELLTKYLSGEPTNSAAWYELAAIRCATGHEDESMDALREAVKFGDEETRRAATTDPRFTAISEKWSFRRLTKVKD